MPEKWVSVWATTTDTMNALLSEWQQTQSTERDAAELEQIRREFTTFRDHLMKVATRQFFKLG